jgi:Cu(I)/Ag(I) efflux system membrane fusion protein
MRKHSLLAITLILGLSILMILSSSVLADKSSSKGETSERIANPDKMTQIFKHYFAIRELLSKDKVENVGLHAKEMSAQIDNLMKTLEQIRASSSELKTDNLEEARKGFASLSQSMLSYLKQFGYAGEAYSFHCPMAKEDWLQENEQIGNPYYGSQMYKCGDMTGMVVNGKYMEKPGGKSSMEMGAGK